MAEYEVTEQHLDTAGVIVHSEYNPVNFENDIAMLITDKDIVFNDQVKPISLPEEADKAQLYAEGAPVTVIGKSDLFFFTLDILGAPVSDRLVTSW